MDTDYTAEITARGAESCCPDNPDAVDASIYADGEYVGETTLVPPEDERVRYTHDGKLRMESWGDGLEHWADVALVAHLEGILDDQDQRDAIDAIEHAVTLSAHTEA